MHKLKLFKVEPEGREAMFITARGTDHAAEIYVAHELSRNRQVPDFSVERTDQTIAGERRLGLDDMLSHGVSGIAAFDALFGWCVAEAF
jgi:hypothetical protein